MLDGTGSEDLRNTVFASVIDERLAWFSADDFTASPS